MQSSQFSVAMAFRVLVTLCCLIAVPLIAVFGKSLADVGKRLWDAWRDNSSAAVARDSLSEAPRFTATAEAAPTPWRANPPATAPAEGTPQVSISLPMDLLSEDPVKSPAPANPTSPPVAGQHPTVPVNYEAETGYGAARTRVIAGASDPPLSNTDQFAYIQQRLRDLGATYYFLESWGNTGQRYRFFCRLAIAGDPSHTRHFEATDPDAMAAMAKVLYDVEAWRAVQ